MSAKKAPDFGACAREPIHLPASIQPHGLLFVVDPSSDTISQAAGDAAERLGFTGTVLGNKLKAVLGASLADLSQHVDTRLANEPTYLGRVEPLGKRIGFNAIAHRVGDVVVVEIGPSVSPPSAAEALASIRSMTERIGGASDLVEACHLAAAEVQRITGYDRVMVYKFFEDASGSVIAEVKDDHLPPFLNHRYPESDIPIQARELYRRNTIRLIPDVEYAPAILTPPLSPATDQPLDMSYCVLRSVSPVHLLYLKNMGVGASMSASLLPRGELWGLIACHNSSAKIVSYEAQEASRHVAQILSHQIRAREESDGHRAGRELSAARDKVMLALIGSDDPNKCLFEICADLQAVALSHGMAIAQKGAIALTGHTPTQFQVSRLVAWLEPRTLETGFYATDRLSEEFPEARVFASEVSGVLAAIIPGDDPTTLMWFRAEQVEEINWAGNPHEPVDPTAPEGALYPRRSFATWQETLKGRCSPWQTFCVESVQGFSPRVAFVLQQNRVRELNQLLELANERLAALAATDGLTGLANRRAFDERLHREWARASRQPARPLSMIILDLDLFKQYNDYYGHVMGDECLKQVAEVLQNRRRASDLAARIGGEEFCVLLPETDMKGAAALAEAIRYRIESLQIPHDGSRIGIVTASLGVAVTSAEKSGDVHDLMRAADKALYEAKETGRNRVVSAE